MIDALEAIASPNLLTPSDSLDVSHGSGSGAASAASPSQQQQQVCFSRQDGRVPPAGAPNRNVASDSTTFVPPPPPSSSAFPANGSAVPQHNYARENVPPESLSPGWLFAAANLATTGPPPSSAAASSNPTSLGLDDHVNLGDDLGFVDDLDQSGALFGGAGWATGGIGAAALDATLFGGLAAFAGSGAVGTGAGWSPPPAGSATGGGAGQTGRAHHAQLGDWASRSPGK